MLEIHCWLIGDYHGGDCFSNEAPIRPFFGLGLVCLAAGLWGTVGVAKNLMVAGEVVDPVLAGLVRTSLGSLAILGITVFARAQVPLPDPSRLARS